MKNNMEKAQVIRTKINHQIYEIEGEKAFMPLGKFLREEACLTGTKIVCAEGDCGACTVVLADRLNENGELEFRAVNSCILPLYLTNGAQVVTVEGIGESIGMGIDLHEVQKQMIDANGAQCGYCTPGFICSMASAVEKCKSENSTFSPKKAKNALTGNLCRCTGYQPIIDALCAVDFSKVTLLKDKYRDQLGSVPWTSKMQKMRNQSINIQTQKNQNLFIPASKLEALEYKKSFTDSKIVGGSTDLGVVVNKGKLDLQHAMALYHIDELKKIEVENGELVVGACVTLTEFENYVEKHFFEMSQMLHIFASPQIKNQATLVGNVINASPIADTIPFLMVSDCKLIIESSLGKREVLITNFYKGYKQLDLQADEIVTYLKIPLLTADEKCKLYKVSMRKDLDISAVTFALRASFSGKKMSQCKIALGGVAATVIRLPSIEAHLNQQLISLDLFVNEAKALDQLISPLSDLRASKEYRLIVAKNFFKKCAIEIMEEL